MLLLVLKRRGTWRADGGAARGPAILELPVGEVEGSGGGRPAGRHKPKGPAEAGQVPWELGPPTAEGRLPRGGVGRIGPRRGPDEEEAHRARQQDGAEPAQFPVEGPRAAPALRHGPEDHPRVDADDKAAVSRAGGRQALDKAPKGDQLFDVDVIITREAVKVDDPPRKVGQ